MYLGSKTYYLSTHLAAVDSFIDPTRLGHAQNGGVDILGFGRQDCGPDFPGKTADERLG